MHIASDLRLYACGLSMLLPFLHAHLFLWNKMHTVKLQHQFPHLPRSVTTTYYKYQTHLAE